MIDSTMIEMMHKDIDGVITSKEETLLRMYLADNIEARDMYEELQALTITLRKISEVKPPADLKNSILSKIDPNLYSRDKKTNAAIFNFGTLFNQQNVRTILAYAAVFIVGLCISPLFLFPPTANNYQNLNEINGSIGVNDSKNLPISQSKQVDQYGISGSVDMKESNNIVWIESKLLSENSFTVQISYQPKELVLILLRPLDPEKIVFEHQENKLTITTTKPFILSFTKNNKTESLLKITVNPSRSNRLEYEFLTR